MAERVVPDVLIIFALDNNQETFSVAFILIVSDSCAADRLSLAIPTWVTMAMIRTKVREAAMMRIQRQGKMCRVAW